MRTETYVCHGCNVTVERVVARGQRPKWCADCRAASAWSRRTFVCQGCGAQVHGTGTKYCSLLCSNRDKPRKPARPKPPGKSPLELDRMWRARRGALRAAIEDDDHDVVLVELAKRSTITVTGCWEWQGRIKDGYPMLNVGKRAMAVHRLSLEAKCRAPLGSQAAHHTCANSGCINPDHLQPVTHRENVAEMMARQSYLARIRELEQALAEVSPHHPLLNVIAVA